MAESWRAVINEILYSVQFERELDDAVVARIARAVLAEPLWDLTPQQEYGALTEALQSGARLTEFIPDRHAEEAYRDFLRRLLARLDDTRPWPEPPFLRLSMSRWESFTDARPIARIGLRRTKVQERLSRVFLKVEGENLEAVQERLRRVLGKAEGESLEVLMLRLRSGDEVALVTPPWPAREDTVILQRDHARTPEQVRAEFINDTRFTADEVTLVQGIGS